MNKKTKKNRTKYSGKRIFQGEKHTSKKLFFSNKMYFLTYKGITTSGEKITKIELAQYLTKPCLKDEKILPQKYLISEEKYEDGRPHFHAILIYPRRKQIIDPGHYDYLGLHPNIQPLRNMKAALEYMYKEDLDPVTNMDVVQEKRIVRAKDSRSLYEFLKEEMLKDPFKFDAIKYCVSHNLDEEIYKTNYPKALKLLKMCQQSHCNMLLADKPTFKIITAELIKNQLTEEELKTYYSWEGYQIIVDHLNQIPMYRHSRPLKTKNLLITGPPDIGKTSFIESDLNDSHNCIERYCSLYPMSSKTWWPHYKSGVYQVISWNEAKLTSYSYDVILKVLEGSKVDLPQKGTSTLKYDNPLVIMTSNLTLDELIRIKFNHNPDLIDTARKNLKVRIVDVVVPEGYNLFLIQKLLIPNDSL